MNFRQIAKMLGGVCLFLCVLMMPSLVLALIDADAIIPFVAAMAMGVVAGGGLLWGTRHASGDIGRREGFVLVSLIWLTASFFGALPYWFSGYFGSFTNAFFESVSGYTTTGATILPHVSHLPRGLLLWRAMTQWLGGMGIVLLAMAVLPWLGYGGVLLFKAEVPGPSVEKLRPRIRATAMLLWWVYVILTAAAALSLMGAGMGWFDALCHGLTVMATGGFSTHDAGIMGFDRPAVEWILIFFMLAAGVNFVLHYRFLLGDWRVYGRNEECRGYFTLFIVFTLLTLGLVSHAGIGDGRAWIVSVRHAAFQCASLMTTTGFHSENYDAWRLAKPAIFPLFLLAMFAGGMGGSTAGGIKTIRLLVGLKVIRYSLYQLIHPRALRHIRINGAPVPGDRWRTMVAFLLLYIVVFFLATLVVSGLGMDEVSAISAVAACLNNIGPGFGAVGPLSNYEAIPTVAKWVLVSAMLIGRLELYTLLVLMTPAFWRR